MAVFMLKAVSRNALRRTHFPSRQQPNIAKRHSTNSNLATRPKVEDDPANGTAIPIPATVANVPLWQRLGPLSRGFQAYGRSQRKRPYATQFCSSLVIYFLGDLSAQNINGDEYDPKRMLRALVISAGSSIPSYKWYVFPRIGKHTAKTVQVHVPGQQLQLLLQNPFTGYESHSKPNMLHPDLQHLFLRHAISPLG